MATDRTRYFNPRGRDERRNPPGVRRTFEVTKMWERHHEIMRRIFLGQKDADIARALGITPATVSYTRNSKIVQDKLAIMKGARDAETVDLSKRIRELAPKALDILEDAMTGKMEGIPPTRQVREANLMMDRAGYGATKTFRAEHLVGHFTAQEIEEIKQRGKEAGKESGSIIDVEEVVQE